MDFRIVRLPDLDPFYSKFDEWILAGFHGEMGYLERRSGERSRPPDWAKAVLMSRIFYNDFSWETNAAKGGALISKYAVRADYHNVLRERVSKLLQKMEERRKGLQYRIFVDSSPVLEKPLAFFAGFGFMGANTLLVDKERGSFFNIGGAFLNIEAEDEFQLEQDNPCINCNLCIDACPTKAIIQPGLLDARRCISYLTIEYRGVIHADLATKMGSWVFGCDICQEICPFNKNPLAQISDSPLKERLLAPPLESLYNLDEAGFQSFFEGTPVIRAGFTKFLRNLIVAAFNSGDVHIIYNICRRVKKLKSPLLDEQIRVMESGL